MSNYFYISLYCFTISIWKKDNSNTSLQFQNKKRRQMSAYESLTGNCILRTSKKLTTVSARFVDFHHENQLANQMAVLASFTDKQHNSLGLNLFSPRMLLGASLVRQRRRLKDIREERRRKKNMCQRKERLLD